MWPFVAGAGLSATAFGLLYGEFFGPTGVLPVVWLAPLDEPVPLLAAAVGVGAVLLAGAYLVAIVNRWREGGPRNAVYAFGGHRGCRGVPRARRGHRLLLLATPSSSRAPFLVPGLVLVRRGVRRRGGRGRHGPVAGRHRVVDASCGSGFERGVVRALGGVRADPCGAGLAGLVGDGRPLAPRPPGCAGRGGVVRRRERADVRPRGARRRGAGAAAGVLRVVLAHFRRRGQAVPALAGSGPSRDGSRYPEEAS